MVNTVTIVPLAEYCNKLLAVLVILSSVTFYMLSLAKRWWVPSMLGKEPVCTCYHLTHVHMKHNRKYLQGKVLFGSLCETVVAPGLM